MSDVLTASECYQTLAEIRRRFCRDEIVVIEIESGPNPTVQEILVYVRTEVERLVIAQTIDISAI